MAENHIQDFFERAAAVAAVASAMTILNSVTPNKLTRPRDVRRPEPGGQRPRQIEAGRGLLKKTPAFYDHAPLIIDCDFEL
ncbi:MAG TPA: hypothetical protein VLG93_09020 [Sulfuricaulis sp.]|nr:hypothetical protein [Sulfuricaulis sp.]